MKTIYFMRHGLAVKKTNIIYDDKDRPLTEDGIQKIIRETKGLIRMGLDIDLIISSPLKRAMETAIIVASGLRMENKIEILEELSPDTSFNKFMKALEKYENKNKILLVGHEPHLSVTISMILGLKNPCIILKKGSICRIDSHTIPPDETANIVWLMQPKGLRLLGGKK